MSAKKNLERNLRIWDALLLDREPEFPLEVYNGKITVDAAIHYFDYDVLGTVGEASAKSFAVALDRAVSKLISDVRSFYRDDLNEVAHEEISERYPRTMRVLRREGVI